MFFSTILLGHIMTITGATGLVAMNLWDIRKKYKKDKLAKESIEKSIDINEEYTHFFENLGLMDTKKGDWIKVIGDVEKHEFYSKVSFYLSDTLSIASFQKDTENIRQKLKVANLEIYEENGRMIFRSRAPELPAIPYEYTKTPKNLIPLGLDLDGKIAYWNLKKDPHAIVVGTSGSGKSNLLNVLINHILRNYKGCKLFLGDYKGGMELSTYENVSNVISYSESLNDADKLISDIEAEYNSRVEVMKKSGYRDYNKFVNDKPNTSMKRAFVIIDEFSMLLRLNSKKDEFDAMETLIDLSKRIRAVGMHLILACQKPTITNVPSDLKTNVSCIIGMKTRDAHNSELVIDKAGLEKLDIGESISIIGGEDVFFKAYCIDDETIESTVKQFSKTESAAEKAAGKDTGKVKDLFK